MNNIEMYSTYNKGKSVFPEKFIRTLKNKIFKHMTAISKNIYFDVLDEIVSKYNNTVHRIIKMKPIDVTSDSYPEYNENSNKKDLKFKIGDFARVSKYKNVFAKGYAPNWSEEVFVVNKIKNTVPWTYVINELNGEEIAGSFYEKELQKASQEKFRIEKVIKKRAIYCTLSGKDMTICLILGLIKKTLYKMSQYFSKPFKNFGGNINVKLNLSYYATKSDLKNIAHVGTSNFVLKANLASLKT